jgi:hypothetical protein
MYMTVNRVSFKQLLRVVVHLNIIYYAIVSL